MTNWISVKERLPENPGYYLVVWKGDKKASYEGLGTIKEFKKYITCRMPLPEPPEGN